MHLISSQYMIKHKNFKQHVYVNELLYVKLQKIQIQKQSTSHGKNSRKVNIVKDIRVSASNSAYLSTHFRQF